MKKWYTSTFVRYFMSYFIVLLALLIAFIVVMQSQLTRNYTETLYEDVEQRLNIVQERLFEDLSSVMQLDILLKGDSSLLNYRYIPSRSNHRQLYKVMCNLESSNGLVESITYLDKKSGDVLSTKYVVKYENDICNFYVGNKSYEAFDLKEVEKKENFKLFFREGNESVCFWYFPAKARENYMIFYTLDLNSLDQMLKDNMINGMDALVLINREEACIYGIHAEKLGTEWGVIPGTSGIYPWSEAHSLYVHANAYGDYSLAALISNQYIADQTYDAMRAAYLIWAGIGLTGLVLIFLSMKLTYTPLAKLFQVVVSNPEDSKNYIDQMATTYVDTFEEIKQLQEKINKYYVSIRKSLLDSGIESKAEDGLDNIQNIDQIFRADQENCIYILRISCERNAFSTDAVKLHLQGGLPKDCEFITLESGMDYMVFAVNYMEQASDREESFGTLLTELHEKEGYLCALSNSTSSLIDIPVLYENSLRAAGYWPDVPVVVYSRISSEWSKHDDAIYPYRLLTLLSDSLERLDFTESEVLLKRLLAQVAKQQSGEMKYPDFLIRSLLIDILMALFSAMNCYHVKYDIYKDLYYETLYYCRSCGWLEKSEEITYNLLQLLELFRVEQSRIRANQIREYLEQNYASPELNVSTMADYFHVNSVYMSYVIKKELGDTFVNYLWKLRFEKAKELMLHTDLPIDMISTLVGYENSSSFRRKFKQEIGRTPSQFRKEESVFNEML